jgi:hypothetical protein
MNRPTSKPLDVGLVYEFLQEAVLTQWELPGKFVTCPPVIKGGVLSFDVQPILAGGTYGFAQRVTVTVTIAPSIENG